MSVIFQNPQTNTKKDAKKNKAQKENGTVGSLLCCHGDKNNLAALFEIKSTEQSYLAAYTKTINKLFKVNLQYSITVLL